MSTEQGPAAMAWAAWKDGTGTLDLQDVLRGMNAADAAIAELEAALAERDRMLLLMVGEYRRVADIDLIVDDEMVLADLRARPDERPMSSRR